MPVSRHDDRPARPTGDTLSLWSRRLAVAAARGGKGRREARNPRNLLAMSGHPGALREPRYRGWHQVACAGPSDEVAPAAVGEVALALVTCGGTVRAFDAHCPHRGAHLGYGGHLDGSHVVCPFHGRRIALGERSGGELFVREYRTLTAGGAVFALLDERHENGLGALVQSLAPTHCFVPGFTLEAAVPAEVVIENAVDADHFHAVHGIDRVPRFERLPSEHGELAVEAMFDLPRPNPWQAEFGNRDGAFEMRFLTRVFSPNLVATQLGSPPANHVVFTAATPGPDGTCVIRVTVAYAVGTEGVVPADEAARQLVRDSRTAFEQDMVIWEHLAPDHPWRGGPSDWPVAEYRQFCERFA